MQKIIYFLIAITMLNGCRHVDNQRFQQVDNALQHILSHEQLVQTKQCIVIPRAGCGGCIDYATIFIKFNVKKFNHVQIFFTGVTDRKLLHLELGDTVLNLANVHIDNNNLFQALKVKSIYPQIVTIQNGSASKIQELDPDNKKLYAMLTNKDN